MSAIQLYAETDLQKLLQVHSLEALDKNAILTLLQPEFSYWALRSSSRFSQTPSAAFFTPDDCLTLALEVADGVLSSKFMAEHLKDGDIKSRHLMATIRQKYNHRLVDEIRLLTNRGKNLIPKHANAIETIAYIHPPLEPFDFDIALHAVEQAIAKQDLSSNEGMMMRMVLNNAILEIQGEQAIPSEKIAEMLGWAPHSFGGILSRTRKKLSPIKPGFCKALRGEISWEDFVNAVPYTRTLNPEDKIKAVLAELGTEDRIVALTNCKTFLKVILPLNQYQTFCSSFDNTHESHAVPESAKASHQTIYRMREKLAKYEPTILAAIRGELEWDTLQNTGLTLDSIDRGRA